MSSRAEARRGWGVLGCVPARCGVSGLPRPPAPAGITAPPMTFVADGKQYVAVLVGIGGAWDKWNIQGTPELKRIQPSSMLYVFAP